MRRAEGSGVQNRPTVKLLSLPAVRKGEPIAARGDAFELEAAPPVWHLPGTRAKTCQPLDLPLPTRALKWPQKPKEVSAGGYLHPADA